MSTKTITHGGADYALECTCSACPEQYVVRVDGVKVGYMRLRWGEFEVYFPNVEGAVIYSADPEGDGAFEDNERDGYLRAAVEAIARRLQT